MAQTQEGATPKVDLAINIAPPLALYEFRVEGSTAADRGVDVLLIVRFSSLNRTGESVPSNRAGAPARCARAADTSRDSPANARSALVRQRPRAAAPAAANGTRARR